MRAKDNSTGQRAELTLSEFAAGIKNVVANNFHDPCWIRAETSDVRINASGHCYLELIEKSERTGQIAAKIRASIWASVFYKLKYAFEHIAGQPFASGIKVLVRAKAEYHELYGLNLNIIDIDPAYTIGDMLRKRLDIIHRLQEDGVYTLNKELPLPILPKRIAVISSQTAAGYGDFMDQLENNHAGYAFYCKLFPAVMQGEKTEASIITALERIFEYADLFDIVIIIRGGGATSELSAFDSYDLAAHAAQFPLPILTGIGHDRDETILDAVAYKMLKTPTAVAEYLVSIMDATAGNLEQLRQDILATADNRMQNEKRIIHTHAARLPFTIINRMERSRNILSVEEKRLPIAVSATISHRHNRLDVAQSSIRANAEKHISVQNHNLQLTEQFIRMASPEYNLKRGYTLVLKDGKIVKRAAALSFGDGIAIRFIDGSVDSRIV